MKTKDVLLKWVCSFLLIATAVVNAEQVLSADDLRGQATILYKDGQAAKALVILHQARKEYEKVLTVAPEDVQALQGLAMTLFDLGEYGSASEVFKKAGVEVKVKSFDAVEIASGEATDAEIASSDASASSNELVAATNVAVAVSDDEVIVGSNIVEVARVVSPSDMVAIKLAKTPSVIRGIELHPGLIYDGRANLVMGNIIAFADRALAMKVNAVFVHAFVKVNADGAFGAAYFNNSVLPVRADIMNPLVKELSARDIAVYAIMPVLSFALPETDSNKAMMVMSERLGEVRPSVSWRYRLSPFNTNSISLITQIYSDLASNVPLNGIVFGDDAYLTDTEDLNQDALNVYSNKLGINKFVFSELDPVQRNALADLRSEQIDLLCKTIMISVKEKQPQMQFIRTLYATAVNHPPSEEWLAQNYKTALQIYNRVLVLADPELENARSRGSWIRNLCASVVAEPSGAERTIFALPNYSNVQRGWISARQQAKLVRVLSKAGLNSFVLGPDDYIANRPRLKKIKRLF